MTKSAGEAGALVRVFKVHSPVTLPMEYNVAALDLNSFHTFCRLFRQVHTSLAELARRSTRLPVELPVQLLAQLFLETSVYYA